MRYCMYCGAQVTEGAKFCMSCGKSVQDTSPAVAEPPVEATVPIPATPMPAASTPATPMPAASAPAEPAPPAAAPTIPAPVASAPADPAPAATPSWRQQPPAQQQPASWQQSQTWQTQQVPQAEQYNGQPYQYAPAGGAYVPAGTVAAPPKKRSKGVVAGVVIAIIAVIAAVVFGLWWFLWRGDDLNPAGRYTMSNGYQTFELVIEDDGAFKVSDTGGSGDYLAGVIGEGTVDGDNVRYPLSDIKASTGDGEMTLFELIGQADSSGIGSAMVDAIEVEVTAPKNAVHGNIVGTWGLSGSLLTFSAEIHITANADGTVEAGMTAFGEEPSNATGTWTDNGNGQYTVTFDNGSPLTVTLPQ